MNNKLYIKFSDFVNEKMSSFDKFAITDKLIEDIYEGYAEAALWTEEDSISEEDVDLNIYNINKLSKEKAIADIKKFIDIAGKDAIDEAIGEKGASILGHDIWLTRNGHGAGFSDRDYVNSDILEKTAKVLGEVTLLLGDDGQLYFE